MYQLLHDRRVASDLRPIPAIQRRQILRRIEQLTIQPRHPQVQKLSGIDGYRLRVGDDRVLFTIHDRLKLVTIYRVLHRREAYR